MAKISSPWVGIAKGKLGEAVYYRQNGETLARARNRQPANPNTEAQLIQRAITATVMQAYSAGIKILDHSFQGEKVPSGSQRAFMSANMKLLRNTISRDLAINNSASECEGVVVQRGANGPVPFAYQVSRGTLTQPLFVVVSADIAENVTEMRPAVQLVALTEAEKAMTIPAYLATKGVAAGDIFTIVAYGCSDNASYYYRRFGEQPVSRFGFVRLTVKDVSESAVLMSAATFDDVFVQDTEGATFPGSQLLSSKVDIDQVINGALFGAIGVVRSRDDSKLRSTCVLEYASPDIDYTPQWGVKSTEIASAWNPETATLGQSELILEGGNF